MQSTGDLVGPKKLQLYLPGVFRALAQGLAHSEIQQAVATYDDHLGRLLLS